MRFTDRRRRQSGQSLIEVTVASALVGIAVVAGLTTIDASVNGVRNGVHAAWARCIVRNEAQMIYSTQWSAGGYAAPANVSATITGTTGSGVNQLQQIVVTAKDTDPPHNQLFTATIYKSIVLSATQPADTSGLGGSAVAAVAAACQGLLGG